jgi:predicted dehydrogenase
MRALAVGVVGCGNIAGTYLRNAPLFKGVAVRACADISATAAQARAHEFGIRALSVEALLAADDVDLVLNLTVPSAHFAISMAALSAGKHVFTEKPLATTAADGRRLVAEARSRGLALGSAPDTFLGEAGRLARRLVDEGAIGRVVAGTAFMMTRGMEHWHPNPQFYYQSGGGPMLDMGPYYLTMLVNLLGPATRVTALATTGTAERTITAAGPLHGTSFAVGTPTTIMALIAFANGATINVGMSWDVFRHGNQPIELHGTEGSLRLPDPDTFGGAVALSAHGAAWQAMPTHTATFGQINWPSAAPDRANYRMLGLADLAHSLAASAPPRASGEVALHVLEIAEAILQAAATGASVNIADSAARPAAMSESDAAALRAM